MKWFISLFAMAIFATTMLFSMPSTASADTISLQTLCSPMLLAETQGDQPTVLPQSSWGALKMLYRGNTPVPYTAERVQESAGQFRKGGATLSTLSGSVLLNWPFGTPKPEWRGWEGDRSGGGTIKNYCGSSPATVNSHSAGDYYARDLSRLDGRQGGQPIYASTGGYVLVAGKSGCYGYSVIIWDPTRNIEVRYSHLSSVNPYVGPNMSIRLGALIGWVGGTACDGVETFTPHLHMVVYKNLVFPKIGQICTGYPGTSYACPFYFN